MEEKKGLLLDVQEKPQPLQWAVLSIQHVFAMFGATILVPVLTGLPVSVALFCSGLGTLIYILCTRAKVPVYLGSSFAYITAVNTAISQMGGDVSAAQTGLILVGFVYVVVSSIVKVVGKDWIDKLLPPIVIGPMIAVIGLGLAPTAISQAGFVAGGDIRNMVVAIFTFIVTALISTKAKGFFKIIPFLCGIVAGYVFAAILGIVDFTPIFEVIDSGKFVGFPEFYLPFSTNGLFNEYHLYFGPETWAMIPVALVTISEHIGDHSVLGKVCGRNFLKDPGLDRTLLGDGIATAVSGFLGGPANTTYGENTGVVGMTKVASIWVIGGAACIAIGLSFFPIVQAVIETIPQPVLGGMALMLYGVIASNGLSVLVENHVDFSIQRNLIICAVMLVIGIGGAVLPIGNIVTLSSTAFSAIVGIILNFVLPSEEKSN
ncbi:MAG: uracil-xanthine permease family protein [Traorella sp.]